METCITAKYDAMSEFLNFEYSPVLTRFIPEKPERVEIVFEQNNVSL